MNIACIHCLVRSQDCLRKSSGAVTVKNIKTANQRLREKYGLGPHFPGAISPFQVATSTITRLL